MNIQPVTPTPARPLLCCCCGAWRATHADLNGAPFRAFYCLHCAEAAQAADTDTEE
jgi:hypothetical protein